MTMTPELEARGHASAVPADAGTAELDVALFLVLAGSTVLGTHALLFRGGIHGVSLDEGYLAAFGLRMIDGHFLPYVDAVSHRGPLLYALSAAFQWCFGKFDWLGIRLLACTLTLASVAGCYLVGRASGRPRAGAIAAALLAFMLCACVWYQAGLSVDGELASLPFALAATALALTALRRPLPDGRQGALLVAGCLAALAALTKQTSAAVCFVLFLGCVARALELRSAGSAAPWRGCVAFAVGVVTPVALLVAVYAARGQLSALGYWLFRYNSEIYLDPYRGPEAFRTAAGWWSRSQFAVVFSVGAAMGLFSLVRSFAHAKALTLTALFRAYRQRTPEVTVALLVVLSFAAALSPLRMFPHYFVLLYPWLALEFAFFLEERWVALPGWRFLRFVLALVMLAVLAGRLEILGTSVESSSLEPDGTNNVCAALDRFSKRGDAIIVWGFDADVYLTCQRAVATKYVFSTPVLGVVPPRFGRQRDRWVVPGARAEMAAEIERVRPKVVLDNVGRFMGKGIGSVPELRRVLGRDYCLREEVPERGRTFQLYTRKEDGC